MNYMLKAATAPKTGDLCDTVNPNRTFQATVKGIGAVSATVDIEGSNDAEAWLPIGTITLSGTTMASDGFVSSAMWMFCRANLKSIAGANSAVNVTLGV